MLLTLLIAWPLAPALAEQNILNGCANFFSSLSRRVSSLFSSYPDAKVAKEYASAYTDSELSNRRWPISKRNERDIRDFVLNSNLRELPDLLNLADKLMRIRYTSFGRTKRARFIKKIIEGLEVTPGESASFTYPKTVHRIDYGSSIAQALNELHEKEHAVYNAFIFSSDGGRPHDDPYFLEIEPWSAEWEFVQLIPDQDRAWWISELSQIKLPAILSVRTAGEYMKYSRIPREDILLLKNSQDRFFFDIISLWDLVNSSLPRSEFIKQRAEFQNSTLRDY